MKNSPTPSARPEPDVIVVGGGWQRGLTAGAVANRRWRSSARAERLQSRLAGSHALASQVTGWILATQARLGMPGETRVALMARRAACRHP